MRFGSDVIGIDDRLIPGERGRTAYNRLRVAMREYKPGIGENLEQRRQVQHVLRRLQHPRPERTLLLRPADQPQQVGHVAIGRDGALLFAPAGIGRYAPLGFELHAIKAGRYQPQFLLRLKRTGRVDRQCTRVRKTRHLEDATCQHGSKVFFLARHNLFEVGPRNRADSFETAQMRETLVRRQQPVQARRTRPHGPHDHDRVPDRSSKDFRVSLEPHLRVQAVTEQVMELLHGREIARSIEMGFCANRIEQDIQRAREPFVTEIVETIFAGDIIHQPVAAPLSVVDQPNAAPGPDPGVHCIDKTAASRRCVDVALQFSVSFCFWLS